MSKISADTLSSRSGGSISISNGVSVTGIVTATSFVGSGASLTNLNIPSSYSELDGMLFG